MGHGKLAKTHSKSGIQSAIRCGGIARLFAHANKALVSAMVDVAHILDADSRPLIKSAHLAFANRNFDRFLAITQVELTCRLF